MDALGMKPFRMSADGGHRVWLRLLSLFFALILIPVTSLASQTGRVNTSALILRQSASKSSKALQTLPNGTSLTITGSSGDWYKVTYGKYSGYVMKCYVTVSGGSSSSQSNIDSTLLRKLKAIGRPTPCASGAIGSNVKKLQRCLTACGYYKGPLDGVYGTSTKAAVKKLQKAKHLKQDGIASRQTIAAMFGETIAADSTTYVTERLDWFKEGPQTIPKGAVFTVKDCKTGKTFQCKRWSGANHCDTMPLTKQDTAIMKSLYGGKWSWRRRSILVLYNGHVYAASMNGMPHGTTTIKNNNFPGHFCIHFYGSKTHGTKRVDPTHQNCVAIAMKYKW